MPDKPTSASRENFRKEKRIRKRPEFQSVFEKGRVESDALLLIRARHRGEGKARLGVVVSRKYGNAVKRNRFKRLVREAFRKGESFLPAGFDIVVRPRSQGKAPSIKGILESLKTLTQRLGKPKA